MLVSLMGIPEPALLLQDFVNTRDVEVDVDEINTPGRLRDWLVRRELLTAALPGSQAVTQADVRTAVALREGLRTAMLGHHVPGADPVPPGLNEALAALPLRVVYGDGAPSLVPCSPGLPGALARIAAAIMAAQADGTWTRLKACQEDTCHWAFLDTSKNRSRAWCSMRVCGNRTKTRAYRARRRTGAAT